MKLKLVCPACHRSFGFERTNLEGIWKCIYCGQLYHTFEIIAKESEAGKEYKDEATHS